MSKPEFRVLPVEDGDTEEIMKLLQITFFVDEPMNQAIGLCNDGPCAELDDYCRQCLPEGLSFKAVDKDGKVVGVMINGKCPLEEAKDGSDYLSLAQKCQNPKFVKILYVLAKRDDGCRLWEKYPEDEYLVDVKVAATHPEWRKRGIMNALLEETEKTTQERGIRLLRMDTSSAYSAMSAERLGFTCVYSARYVDIKLDGRPLIVPEPPHVDDRVYIKTLFDRK
ncbi:dopamine N-acetyltransferase-like [Trichoplusia ni]|uniref:aralkylamine N-acetyltransferase n=1 Tax=Trichoplusia ni TaxID=7111 RepID=A0A7E5VPU5_TRINI|nr:dopamine N-acetyltransferase-like [Trichoplusia ni]XP_026730353.1 dopamine N-acetyltransferase-like [Trichoplusia ni]